MATATETELEATSLIIDPEKHYEVVDGRIVEEPPLSAHEVWIAATFDQSMGYHARTNRLGRVATEMLFVIDRGRSLRRRPDVAFVSSERWSLDRPIPRENAWDVVPDLAIEITSPTDMIDDLMDKLEEYFHAGVRLVWVVYSKHRKVYMYDSTTSVRILQVGDELDGGVMLPGFRMTLASLFEVQEDGPTPSV